MLLRSETCQYEEGENQFQYGNEQKRSNMIDTQEGGPNIQISPGGQVAAGELQAGGNDSNPILILIFSFSFFEVEMSQIRS